MKLISCRTFHGSLHNQTAGGLGRSVVCRTAGHGRVLIDQCRSNPCECWSVSCDDDDGDDSDDEDR